MQYDSLDKGAYITLTDERLPFKIYNDKVINDDAFESDIIMEALPKVLKGKERTKFLQSISISEKDKIYIYNMYLDKVYSFSVKKTQLVEKPNLYMDTEIGFKISNLPLKSMGDFYWNTFVYIGGSNPFNKGNARPIKWTETDSTIFPINLKSTNHQDWHNTFSLGKVYKYAVDGYTYLIQNLNTANEEEIAGRHLIVYKGNNIDSLIFNKIYMDTESATPSPLITGNENIQWTGEIFKGKPPIIYGFLFFSFGCPWKIFFGGKEPSIGILCDNRH